MQHSFTTLRLRQASRSSYERSSDASFSLFILVSCLCCCLAGISREHYSLASTCLGTLGVIGDIEGLYRVVVARCACRAIKAGSTSAVGSGPMCLSVSRSAPRPERRQPAQPIQSYGCEAQPAYASPDGDQPI